MKKKGRSRGAEKTVIGLPHKKKKTDKSTPFLKLKKPIDEERGKLYMNKISYGHAYFINFTYIQLSYFGLCMSPVLKLHYQEKDW